ncbi:hypothetical protein VCHENC02_4756B, partial [Vibrio harveyi]
SPSVFLVAPLPNQNLRPLTNP